MNSQGPSKETFLATAILIAASADEFHSLVEAAIEERALGHAAPPPLQEWLENYRQGPGSALIDVFSGLPDVVSAFSSSLQLPGDRHLDPNLTMIRVPSDEVLAAVLKHQESAFEIDDEDVLPHMTSCAGQFLLQVWLPSWVLHREYPTRLFALASEGDVDALVALVELDKCAILAPELAPHWDHAMRPPTAFVAGVWRLSQGSRSKHPLPVRHALDSEG